MTGLEMVAYANYIWGYIYIYNSIVEEEVEETTTDYALSLE